MRPRDRIVSMILGLGLALLSDGVAAESTPTGTRLPSGASAQPRTSLGLEEPEAIVRVRQLLAAGNPEAARSIAVEYARQVRALGLGTVSRFFAYSGLCVCYTALGRFDAAERSCTQAVEVMPGQWSGWNNRGAARMLVGDADGARADYEKALSVAGDREAIVALVRHNLELIDSPVR